MLVGSCSKSITLQVEPQELLTISVSEIRFEKSKNRITGFVQIDNKSTRFVRVSNQELFLYSGNDSSRTFVSTPGEWKIDEGLINILAGKSITFRAYWPISRLSDTLALKYLMVLSREN